MEKEPILISACLLGLSCRYDGCGKTYAGIDGLQELCAMVPVCPEQMGGLSTPRTPAERRGNLVVTAAGTDVTEQYERGAEQTLKLAEQFGCRAALLKEKSPSCGCGRIYDGTFSGTLTGGDGVTARLLLEHGIEVFGENQLDRLKERLNGRKEERSE